jgi:hypothetical protein
MNETDSLVFSLLCYYLRLMKHHLSATIDKTTGHIAKKKKSGRVSYRDYSVHLPLS